MNIMPILHHNYDLRKRNDREELLPLLASAGIKIDEAAIQFSLDHLTEDWFQIPALDSCPLRITKSGSMHAIHVHQWARLLQYLYEFRNHTNIEEQVRRLCLRSHEKLDTILVVLVAGRYHRRKFEVIFEPNGKASTDLLLSRERYRLYAEIKRENPSEHRRQQRIQSVSGSVCGRADRLLRQWLKEKQLRVEIKLSKLFADNHVDKVVKEIEEKAKTLTVRTEAQLASVAGSRIIVLPRSANLFYEKGIHTGQVIVEKAGTPVQIAPENMLVQCIFDARPNLIALGERLREAGKQLARDLSGDQNTDGLVVMESLFGGDEACKAIQTRFWSRLPQRCWGVTLLSNPGYVVPRSDLSAEQIEVLKHAAFDI
jgi:hypothetical protein